MRYIVKKSFAVANQAGIALIVQVKSNQPSLLRTITEIAATTKSLSSCDSHDKGRGRVETRTVTAFYPADKFDYADWKAYIQAIFRVERVVYTRSAKTGLLRRRTETAFYVSNERLSAACAALPIRAHWGIENTSHYSRDVTLREDHSRIRRNPGVFARLRSFGFNILKANRTGTLSQDRYRAALGGFDALSSLSYI